MKSTCWLLLTVLVAFVLASPRFKKRPGNTAGECLKKGVDFFVSKRNPGDVCSQKSLLKLDTEVGCAALNAEAGGTRFKNNLELGALPLNKNGWVDLNMKVNTSTARRTIFWEFKTKIPQKVCFNANTNWIWAYAGDESMQDEWDQEATIPEDDLQPFIWRMHGRTGKGGTYDETPSLKPSNFMSCTGKSAPGCNFHGQIVYDKGTGVFQTCIWKSGTPIYPEGFTELDSDKSEIPLNPEVKECVFFEKLPADEKAKIEEKAKEFDTEYFSEKAYITGIEASKTAAKGPNAPLGDALALPHYTMMRFFEKNPVASYADGLCKGQFEEALTGLYGRCYDLYQCVKKKTSHCEGSEEAVEEAKATLLDKKKKKCDCAAEKAGLKKL